MIVVVLKETLAIVELHVIVLVVMIVDVQKEEDVHVVALAVVEQN